MTTRQQSDRPWRCTVLGGATLLLLGVGCAGVRTADELLARGQRERVTAVYRPGDQRPELPALTSSSPLADYLRFAVLNSPRVEAAYYEWAAAIERIVPARTRADPRLTFQADVTDTVMALMPGLMLDLPGPGKLRLAADVMAAESRVAYFGFEREILRAVLAVKTAYYRLHFLAEVIRVQQETLRLLTDFEQLAQMQNAAGKVTLQDVLRAQIARDQTETRIANLEDSRHTLAAELKAALGLSADAAAPPLPATFEPATGELRADELWSAALARNPDLRALDGDVLKAEAALALARQAGVPDFTLGIELDLRPSPTVVSPSAGMTLPIWRDRLAALIAEAQADKRAATARLSAAQVQLAAELASLLYLHREASRTDALLRNRLLPKARQSLEAARAGYVTGRTSFLDLIDAQRTLLEFELLHIDAQTQRELALAKLSLTIAGTPPAGTPVLNGPANATLPPRSEPQPQEARP